MTFCGRVSFFLKKYGVQFGRVNMNWPSLRHQMYPYRYNVTAGRINFKLHT